ncbi:predicted protein [Nematostella vectensis]|uniref:Protein FAM166B n=1 Tax=Nematostella vectensis TaxID=45351 RepID=A7RIM2_NEMVE|nr:protein FAM166B [Nematostella vectensis]EDO48739.1 predicted protein [Nematostella vectensis]|eukprot:XP_001640802.1 predicted protein [Nematostella vectensis]
MGFTELTHPHIASNLPGYRGYCPQLKYECGHTYGIATDKLTTRHMRNEKLITTRLPDPKEREQFLPQPNGVNKLTANMKLGYTGYIPTMRYLYGSRYREATDQAISDFMQKDEKYRNESDDLKKTVYSTKKLQPRADHKEPSMYPDLRPRYGKDYFPSEHREFTEAPLPGYTGYVPRRRAHDLGMRYGTWSQAGFSNSLEMRNKQENLATQRIDVTKYPEPTVTAELTSQGTLYKLMGMKPKYTGYIPQRRFRYGNTYGDTTRSLPVCFDPKGYASATYVTVPVM